MFDLIFLVRVLLKGVDGVLELLGGIALLALSPTRLQGLVGVLTAHELAEDPHDLLANLLLQGPAHLDASSTGFLAAYLLLHGIVKLAIVTALLLGSHRVYPWAILALFGFLVFQIYELFAHPSVLIALLTVLDALIVWLTWREWRRGRLLRQTMRNSLTWILRKG